MLFAKNFRSFVDLLAHSQHLRHYVGVRKRNQRQRLKNLP